MQQQKAIKSHQNAAGKLQLAAERSKSCARIEGNPSIGAGATQKEILKLFGIVVVKLLCWKIIVAIFFAGVVATLPLISAVKSLCYGNFILIATVASRAQL